jgi:hypothetical protein
MTVPSARLTAPLAAAAAALVIAGCGDDSKLLPASDASKLDAALQRVVDATDSGDCQSAVSALSQAQNAFADLPAGVSSALRARISDGLGQLADTVPVQCQEAGGPPAVETPTTTETTTTEPTTTEPTTTVPPPTGPTGPADEAPPTAPADEPNGGVAPGADGNGNGNGPDGNGPPGQLKKGDG